MSLRSPWYYVALVPRGRKSEPVDLTDRVLSFEFTDNERKTDKLRLSVNNFDLANFDDPVWRHGALLRVGFGNGVSQAPIREVVVRKVTGGRVLTIEANDRAVELDTVKKRCVFENMTRSEIIRQVAIEGGFGDPDIEDTSEVFEIVNQGNLTDAQFMRKLAHLEGFQFFVDFDGLHWHRRRTGQAPLRTLTYYAADPSAGGDILDFAVENDITRKPGRVRVAARDPMEQEEILTEADNDSDPDRDVLQEFMGIFDPETGQLTQQELVSVETTIPSNVETLEDAEVEAKGKFRLATQRAVKMNIKVRGAPDLLGKSVVTLSGLGKRLSGKYYVRSNKHSLSGSSGYTCSLKLITDGFQRGFGSGGGDGAVDDAAILSCLEALKGARATITGATIGESQIALGQLATGLNGLIANVLAVSQASGAQRAKLASGAAKSSARVAQFAASLGRADIAGVVTSCAGLMRRITEVEDATSEGNVNQKNEGDQNRRQAIATIDPETGQPVTSYIDKRGRDA